ncbi:hypothetical protein CBL_11295 [Carabus blaptoides fortunei]
MSLEDDTDNAEIELRDLVAQTLEENGFLAKIRAQLRAGLYLALESEINTSEDQSTYNASLKSKLAIPEFKIIFCLVREFLEYFDLSYTCSVFEKETFMGSTYRYESREKLIQDLDIGIDTLHNAPLLLEVLNIARSSFNLSARGIHNESNFNNSTLNADDSKLASNVTYEVPSPAKTPNQSVNSDDGGSVRNDSMSESIASEITQPVIGVKTVPKQYVNGMSDAHPLEPKQDGVNVHETSPNEDKSESVSEDMDSHQSEVQLSSKKVIQLSKQQNEEVEYKFETDDTYEGTSSIAEDSVVSNNKEHSMLIDFDKSVKLPVNVPNSPPTLTAKHIIDQTMDDSVRSPKLSFSPENPLNDKRKLDKSDRVEKLKPMSSLTSLSDLPPLPVTKNRNADTVLLPSLYSKDFREKSTKDIDKLLDINFDSLDNYEEDFMSSGSLDNEDAAVNNSFIPKQTKNLKVKNDNKTKPSEVSGRQQHTVKQPLKELSTTDTKQNIEHTNKINKQQTSESNDSNNRESSVSEDFDLNSNVDDLLKSGSTT